MLRGDTCNLCGGDQTLRFGEMHSFAIVRCRNCGLYYVDPRPTEEQLQKHYARYYSSDYLTTECSFNEGSVRAFLDIVPRCKKLKPTGKVLDVGCGGGFFLAIMKDQGYTVQGVDLSKAACEYAARAFAIDVFHGTLEDAQFSPGSFDIITVNNVLEHVSDPSATLLSVKNLLNPSGVLVVVVPNLDFGRFVWSFYELTQGWPMKIDYREAITVFDAPNHLFFFSAATLRRLLEKAGFSVIEISNALPVSNPGRPVRTALKHLLYWITSLIYVGSWKRLTLGHSLIAVATA